MNILADYHHQGLWHSLESLFEKRLGGQLYRPVGMEWFPQYWRIAAPYGDDPRTATQYLSLKGNMPLGDYYFYDGGKGLTFEQFKALEIDLLIASIPEHLPVYTQLIKEYQPKAKLIFQIGNEFPDIDFSLAKNILSSTQPFPVPAGINAVFYHQEFELYIYHPSDQKPDRFVRSFVHCLSQGDGQGNLFRSDWKDFVDLEDQLPEYKFEAYGAACRDGCIHEQEKIAEMMRESKYGFNLKTGGDGFGHTIHAWFAVGRPVIVRRHQYENKLAGQLMVDGATCIDLDKGNPEENVKRLRSISPEQYAKLCQNAYDRFKQIVDFDKEEIEIRKFIERLV